MMTKTWMVGKVEAPAKANRIELKAEKHPYCIRQSREFLGILTFSKICETGGTWMVCLPPWMRWGLAWPVRGILIITTVLVTHIKTLFHLEVFELLFFLWETSKGYTGWHFKKTNLGCSAFPACVDVYATWTVCNICTPQCIWHIFAHFTNIHSP